MSTDIPDMQSANNQKISSGDGPPHSGYSPHSPIPKFLLPDPLPTRRNRTYSQSERAQNSVIYKGKVESFCRNKGHGFITNNETKEKQFVHISDIDGEYVPKEGDDVSFKLVPMPLNAAVHQAVHVKITHLNPGVSHETWTAPASPTASGSPR